MFFYIQLSRECKSLIVVVQWGLAAVQDGGRPWHCPCDVAFLCAQKVRVTRLWRFHPEFKGRAPQPDNEQEVTFLGQHWRSWYISRWSWRSRCEGDLGRDDARNADWGKPQEWAESAQGKDCVGSKCQGHRVRDALPVGAQITLLHNTARCLVFSLSLIPSLISLPLFFPLGMRMLFIHNYILETCNLFLFYRCSQLRISSKTRRPWTWTFKQFQNYRSLQFEMCISRCRVGVRVMNGIKEMCLGIKLIRSGLVMVVLDSLAGLRNS